MVKIEERYVMNPKEKAEYERVNALPRKASGKVEYYFKRQTKYPPRIYVFMHAEIWQDRNRRPMGLHGAFPFLSRPMNKEEIEYHHFDTRLCYHQYEDWDKLIYAEEKEAEQLDSETPHTGTDFLNKLLGYREKYPLKGKDAVIPPVPPEIPVSEEMRYFKELMALADTLTVAEIGTLLKSEQEGEKRPLILTLLREYYKNAAENKKGIVDEAKIKRKVLVSEERSRRNFVRRVYAKNKLFAMEEIRQRYQQYSAEQLQVDLHIRKSKIKRKKQKLLLDLRRCQLQKLASKLRNDLSETEYQQLCNRIVLLQNAHDLRLPIPLTVKMQGETLVYDFDWRTREGVVKNFVALANKKGMTHTDLKEHYDIIIRSSYSI
jgi:uncharacterized LabA/DUF88 family protein